MFWQKHQVQCRVSAVQPVLLGCAGVQSAEVPVAAGKVTFSSDRMLLSAGSAGTAELPRVS